MVGETAHPLSVKKKRKLMFMALVAATTHKPSIIWIYLRGFNWANKNSNANERTHFVLEVSILVNSKHIQTLTADLMGLTKELNLKECEKAEKVCLFSHYVLTGCWL